MAIWLYKKHPPHNLGGENYPHFENEAQKKTWISVNIINDSQKINLNINRLSFDQASVNLNLKNLSLRADQISGLKSTENNLFFTFWWVVGWNPGANDEVVSLNLTLDYWLTYWPLKFNNSLVKIEKRHVDRIYYYVQKDPPAKILWLNLDNRAFHISEENTPPNIFQTKKYQPKIIYQPAINLQLMIGIVFCGSGGLESVTTDKNYYPKTGVNDPGNQNGWLIFAPADNQAINDWLSFPGITQSFYFFININILHHVQNTFSFDDVDQKNDHRGIYSIKKKQDLDFENKLNAVWFDSRESGIEGYKYFLSKLAQAVFLSYQFKVFDPKTLKLTMDVFLVDQNYKIHFDVGTHIRNCQLFSLKSFFKNNELKLNSTKSLWINQFKRKTKGIYFTTLNIFNKYSNHKKRINDHFFGIDLDLKKIYSKTKFIKTELWDYERDLKIISQQSFYLCFQNKSQEFKFWWFSKAYLKARYYFYWTITLQNSYLNFEPNFSETPKNKKYNFVVVNETKLSNYTDQSLEFFQQQGISFQQGINQAKYQIDWLKRYQSFQDTSFKYRQITGVIKGILGDIAGAAGAAVGAKTGKISTGQASGLAFGLAGDIADRSINTAFNFKEFNLNQELKRKNTLYALKSLQARQADIFNQPITTHNVDNTEFNYWLISKNCLPYVMNLVPAKFDWKQQSLIYHKNGYAYDQCEKIDFNKKTRRCWNFWKIINIEQAIIKNNLNSMVINYFNKIFNDGIRLWNVFYDEVKFNDYSLENWEKGVLENEN